MKKIIFVTIVNIMIFSSTLFASFCNKCGFKASDESIYCSKCGNKLENIESISSLNKNNIILIEEAFSPVNDFEVFLYNSNYLTCVAKFPEYQIAFNKNIYKIEEIEKNSNENEKKIIIYYYKKWEIIKLLQEIWGSNQYIDYQKKAYMTKFIGVLKQINNIIVHLKSGIKENDLKTLENKLELSTKIYEVTSRFLGVESNRIPHGDKIGIEEIKDDKVKIIHLGKRYVFMTIQGPTVNDIEYNPISKTIEGWVSLKEIEKRTNFKNY